MKIRHLVLSALIAGGAAMAMPQNANAGGINVSINTGGYNPPCQSYTRTFIDGYGYSRKADGVACLQPNGAWVTVSENFRPVSYVYPERVVYRDVPIYTPPSAIIISQPRWRDNGWHNGWRRDRDWNHRDRDGDHDRDHDHDHRR